MPNIGDPAPLFSGANFLTGETFTLSEHQGKVILIAFEGLVWCPPCRLQAVVLQELSEQYAKVQFVMVSSGPDSPKGLKTELQKLGITFPCLKDPTIPVLYDVINTVPVLFVIDKEFKICNRKDGALPPADELKSEIEELLIGCGALPYYFSEFDLNKWAAVALILFGAVQDASGLSLVGRKPSPIDPLGPMKRLTPEKRDILLSLAIDELAYKLSDKKFAKQIRMNLYTSIENSAKKLQENINKAPPEIQKDRMPIPVAKEKGKSS